MVACSNPQRSGAPLSWHGAKSIKMDKTIAHVCRLGQISYERAWNLQKILAAARANGQIPDTLLLLEHPPTYTLGRRTDPAHLLVSRDILRAEGIVVVDVDRGGDITYHGPGQVVGYPVLSLQGRPGGPGRYLRQLEEVLMIALRAFDVRTSRREGFTGVWVGDEKIAAIGVKIDVRRITQHGFALNVCTDLTAFSRIVPCGIRHAGVTSLARILKRSVSCQEVMPHVAEAFETVFGLTFMAIPPDGLFPREE